MSDAAADRSTNGSDDLAAAQARIADLSRRLEEAAHEAMAQRDRAAAAAQELDETRAELAAVRRDLELIRSSRSYRAAERIRELLGR